MKVLVTGATGQLGRDVVAACEAAGDEVLEADRTTLDITDERAVHDAVRSSRPHAIVNCAAYTAVDACETNVDQAFAANARAVGYLAAAAGDVDAHLVQVSTDYVFDGTLDRPYREDDVPHPMSVYGRSKLAGELAAGERAAIVRTSWLCGEHGHNMVKLVLRLLGDADLAFVDDQRGCPTFSADLAPALRRIALDRRRGIHHLTNQRAVTWYQFVREVVEAAGRDPAIVRPIKTADLDPPRRAPRPANSELDNAVWRAADLPMLRDFREPLDELVARLS